MKCQDCGTTENLKKSFRRCEPCWKNYVNEWAIKSRTEQGLPPTVEDPAVLAKVAAILNIHSSRKEVANE